MASMSAGGNEFDVVMMGIGEGEGRRYSVTEVHFAGA